jgi:threonine aldolase
MRQAGIIAAAGLVALDTMVDRLAEDHANARRLADILVECGFLLDVNEIETNIVFAQPLDSAVDPFALHAALREEGVLINPPRGGRFRFVTHANVSAEMIEQAGPRIAKAIAPI